MKRIFDVFFSFIGLFLLSPIFVVIAILIKIDSPGNVFFRQERIGRHYSPFFIYKFRTMVKDSHKKGLQITAGGDARITRIGRILRKTKIDEFPQLINVFKGEMSVVGPRPEVRKYVELYNKDYENILSVRPGITDISSITFRDEESILKNQADPEWYYTNILLPDKISLAQEYIRQTSLFYDIKLIFITFYRLFHHAYMSNSFADVVSGTKLSDRVDKSSK